MGSTSNLGHSHEQYAIKLSTWNRLNNETRANFTTNLERSAFLLFVLF